MTQQEFNPIETTTNTSEKMNFIPEKIRKFMGLITLGLLLSTTGGCGSPENTAAQNVPVATAPANPEKAPQNVAPVKQEKPVEANTAEKALTVESLEMDASLMNDPEALIKKFIENENEWFNCGGTMENAKAALAIHDVMSYAKKTAAESDEIFIKAQYIDDWKSNPVLVENINRSTITHAATLICNYCTSSPKDIPKDRVPYKREMVFVNVVSATKNDSTITVKFTEKEIDNSDYNRVNEDLKAPLIVTNVESQPTITFTNVNGKMKISDMVFGTKIAKQ